MTHEHPSCDSSKGLVLSRSEALLVDDGRARLVVVSLGDVLVLGEDHLGQDRAAQPRRVPRQVLRHVLRGLDGGMQVGLASAPQFRERRGGGYLHKSWADC